MIAALILCSGYHFVDLVTADDLIVQGSLCAGVDCVNNESFGFDTVRLKSITPSLLFQDTSASVGFPSVDWRMGPPDETAGAAERFSITDLVTGNEVFSIRAGAPTDALRLDGSGRLGLSTATPVLGLHERRNDTPAVRWDQQSPAQTWDVGANEANFFVRDLTSGSRLPFRVRPGAPSSSLDLQTAGVGIGTASPNAALHVVGLNAADVARFDVAGEWHLQLLATEPSIKWGFSENSLGHFTFSNEGRGNKQRVGAEGELVRVTPSGDLFVYGNISAASSRTLKQQFTPVDHRAILEKLATLNVSEWAYKSSPAVRHIGPTTEDFAAAFELPSQNGIGLATTDVDGITIAALQGLAEIVAEMDRRLKVLEAQQ